MHTTEDQQLLDSWNNRYKFERTSIKSFKERGLKVDILKYWYIVDNEFPYKGEPNHKIARLISSFSENYKGKEIPTGQARQEFGKILKKYKVKGFRKNKEDEMSVNRYHIHLFC